MNINKFKYVIAIAKYQNMTRAAEALYISQPALTKSLNLLEEELGVQLFDRGGTPIRLTFAGELFIEEANKILDLQEHLINEISHIASVQKSRLILGITSDRGSVWLPYLLPAFNRQFPNIELEIIEGNHQELEKSLLNGEADMVLFTLPVYSSQIAFEVIGDDPIVICSSRNHPFAQRFDLSCNTVSSPYLISPKILEDQLFVALKNGTGLRRISEYLFERHGIPYNCSREFLRHETAVRLASEGVGLVVTPAQTTIRTGTSEKMAFFSLDQPVLNRKIIFAYLTSRGISTHGRRLVELTKMLSRQYPVLIPDPVMPVPAIYV